MATRSEVGLAYQPIREDIFRSLACYMRLFVLSVIMVPQDICLLFKSVVCLIGSLCSFSAMSALKVPLCFPAILLFLMVLRMMNMTIKVCVCVCVINVCVCVCYKCVCVCML